MVEIKVCKKKSQEIQEGNPREVLRTRYEIQDGSGVLDQVLTEEK
jgi:hypothetical protein